MTAPSGNLACPCGRASTLAACCGRWHEGEQHLQAPDAESLMRSRYSAFVLDRLDYLRDTWAPEMCPDTLAPNPPGLQWLGLDVRDYQPLDDTTAEVEFVARHRWHGRATRLHERSRFRREPDGRWLYVSGETLVARGPAKRRR